MVRDWTGNLMNFATTFGAYRKRAKDQKDVPHSFTFVRRDCPWTFYMLFWVLCVCACVSCRTTSLQLFHLGMPQQLVNSASNSLPRRYNESPHDVFMLIKGFVSDRDLSQPPLLVWPGASAQESFEALCKIARNEVNSDLVLNVFYSGFCLYNMQVSSNYHSPPFYIQVSFKVWPAAWMKIDKKFWKKLQSTSMTTTVNMLGVFLICCNWLACMLLKEFNLRTFPF